MADQHDSVLFERRDPGSALLTLHRPERLNARDVDRESRSFELLDEAVADPEIKVSVVTGAGKGWGAGADMDLLQGIGKQGGLTAGGAVREPRPQYYTTTISKPVIAAINGACAG